MLFDEIEGFVRSREPGKEGEKPELDNRMLTTSMLILINDLRRKEKIIFIVATNYFEGFDSAVKRPGRFDMILHVGPPHKASMKEVAEEFQGKKKLGENVDLEIVNKIIDEEYDNNLEYFTYGEWTFLLKELNEEMENGLDIQDVEKRCREMVKDKFRSTILSDEKLKERYDENKGKSRARG